MSVNIVVDADELKSAMECVSLISLPAKKAKADDKEGVGVIRVLAECSKDGNYLLSFEIVGNAEQLRYRMDAKGNNSTETAEVYISGSKFIELAKSFGGDVSLQFEENKLTIVSLGSKYRVNGEMAIVPQMTVPNTLAYMINAISLDKAVRHCMICVDKNGESNLAAMQIHIDSSGSAVCWGTNRHRIARFVTNNLGKGEKLSLHVLPRFLQHMVELCGGTEFALNTDRTCIYASSPRFDYMCYITVANMPDCQKAWDVSLKKIKRKITVERSALIAAVNRARIVSNSDDSKIRLRTVENNLLVSSASVIADGYEYVPISASEGTEEDDNYVSANGLLKVLSGCQGEQVTIASGGKFQPYMINATGDDCGFLVAPMRG